MKSSSAWRYLHAKNASSHAKYPFAFPANTTR